MFSPFWLSQYSTLNIALSALVGIGIGVLIAACFKKPITRGGETGLIILILLSPSIGVSTRLIQLNDVIVHLNVFLFALAVTVLVGRLVHDQRRVETTRPAQ